MRKELLLILCLVLFNTVYGQLDSSSVKLRLFNDSRYNIESYLFYFNNVEIKFINVKPKSYSEAIKTNGFYKDGTYHIEVSKKNCFGEILFLHGSCVAIDNIGREKYIIKHGQYTIKIKIKKIRKNLVVAKIEYVENEKNVW